MQDQVATKTAKVPFSTRLKNGDLVKVQKLARAQHLLYSQWIRKICLARAAKIIAGKNLAPLVYASADGYGQRVSVRVNEQELYLLKRAAIKEGALPSTWLRAVVQKELR